MTNEEALDYFQRDVELLKEIPNYVDNRGDIDADLTAICAISRCTPKPPVQDPKTTKWYCVQCGTWIAERQHFCDKCGQAIKWTEAGNGGKNDD